MAVAQALLKRTCIGASALLLSLSAAQAAEPMPAPVNTTPKFSELDTNHDGYIDAREASVSLEVSGWLSIADKDKDGRLSPSEFAAAQAAVGIDPKEASRSEGQKRP
jgi:hypothetical protein